MIILSIKLKAKKKKKPKTLSLQILRLQVLFSFSTVNTCYLYLSCHLPHVRSLDLKKRDHPVQTQFPPSSRRFNHDQSPVLSIFLFPVPCAT